MIKKLAIVVGTRPNFIKAVCLLEELNKKKNLFDYTLINTGQHYDYNMAKVFFEELNIPKPHIQLECVGANHIQTIAKIIRDINKIFTENKFDYVIVFGDVNSTLASAISSIKTNHKLIHVESGLRSNDIRMPEEINRVITDHVSDILFVSEESAIQNLHTEGITNSVYFVGNIMIDTLVRFRKTIHKQDTYQKLGLRKSNYILSTIHRQENIDNPHNLKLIFELLNSANNHKKVVIALHPRTMKTIEESNLNHLIEQLTIIPPQGYLDFLNLVIHSHTVITDSGGIQEETTYLNVPCITLRDTTERPITCTKGTNTMIEINEKEAKKSILDLLKEPKYKTENPNMWDGNTSKRIVNILSKL